VTAEQYEEEATARAMVFLSDEAVAALSGGIGPMPDKDGRQRMRALAGLGIEGARTHSMRHQFATEALADDPR
jgi:hypothetical protein